MKFLFLCCYGRAGYEILNKLILNKYYGYDDIIVFTHSNNNQQLIDYIKAMKLKYYEKSINKCKEIVENKEGLLLSIHYRFIIKKEILECFNGRSINLHPSLLPKYKGCFSSVWALINDEKETGITYHECTSEVDCGNIIIQKKIPISNNDTGYSLFHKLITLGIDNLDLLFELLANNYLGEEQQGTSSYYCRKVPFNGIINKNWDSGKKERFKRAIYFPPFPEAIEE